MQKLTDTQLIVLSKAAAREDGVARPPDRKPAAAIAKIAAGLLARKLVREVRSRTGMPVWRRDEEDRPVSLVLLKAGREAIGVDEDIASPAFEGTGLAAAAGKVLAARNSSRRDKPKPSQKKHRTQTGGSAVPAEAPAGSKRSTVIAMLSAPAGTTVEEIVAATGWQSHTTRAMLTGLRKAGYTIERTRLDGSASSTYRITGQPSCEG